MVRTSKPKVILEAGAAEVDITLAAGVQVAGDVGTARPAQRVIDPLYAKALVVSSGGMKWCFVSLDVTIITKGISDRIREAAGEFGFDRRGVMIHALQIHSAPALGHCMLDDDFKDLPEEFNFLRGSDEGYNDFAVEKIIEAIKLADAACRPVQIAAGRTIEGRVAFNRRGIARDGSSFLPSRRWAEPLGNVDMCCLEGPIDPEVGVMCLRTADMHMVAMLLHHTCHPVNVFPKPVVSADWPGAWCGRMKHLGGPGCIPIVANGCCGNINPFDPFDPNFREDHERMGQILAEDTARVLDTLKFADADVVACASKSVKIPIRPVEPDKLAEARKFIQDNPQPTWTDHAHKRVDPRWFRSANLISLDLQWRRDREVDYEIQVFRVGDVAIVGLPGEPFVEGQLKIKIASPAAWTFVAHCVNQYVGYLPIREAFQHGGHEVNTSTWAKLVPEALEMVVAETTELLADVFKS